MRILAIGKELSIKLEPNYYSSCCPDPSERLVHLLPWTQQVKHCGKERASIQKAPWGLAKYEGV